MNARRSVSLFLLVAALSVASSPGAEAGQAQNSKVTPAKCAETDGAPLAINAILPDVGIARHFPLTLVKGQSVLVELAPIEASTSRAEAAIEAAAGAADAAAAAADATAEAAADAAVADFPMTTAEPRGNRLPERKMSLCRVAEGMIVAPDAFAQLLEDSFDRRPGQLRLRYEAEQAGEYVVSLTGFDAAEVQPLKAEMLVRERPSIASRHTVLEFSGTKLVSDGTLKSDMALYTFNGTAGRSVEILFESVNGDFDPYLKLAGPDPDPVIREDDDSGGNLNARIRLTLSQSGEYRLITRRLFGSGADYRLTLTEMPPPPPFVISQLKKLSPGQRLELELTEERQDLMLAVDGGGQRDLVVKVADASDGEMSMFTISASVGYPDIRFGDANELGDDATSLWATQFVDMASPASIRLSGARPGLVLRFEGLAATGRFSVELQPASGAAPARP